MPALHTYRIFVSHSYNPDGIHHNALNQMLRERKGFKHRGNNVPIIRAIEREGFQWLIRKRIEDSEVMLLLCRPKIARREMTRFELEVARQAGIPIIGVRPPGTVKISKLARDYVLKVVDWDVEEIVDAIRNPHKPARPLTPIEVEDAEEPDGPESETPPPPMEAQGQQRNANAGQAAPGWYCLSTPGSRLSASLRPG